MRICCFSRTNPLQGVKGGMDIHLQLLAEGLVLRGHSVDVISTYKAGIPQLIIKGGVRYHQVPGTVFGSRRKGWPAKSVSYMFELHRKVSFDLLWSNSFDAYGLYRYRLSNIPPLIVVLAGCIAQEITSFMIALKKGIFSFKDLVLRLGGLFYSYFITQRPLLLYSDSVIAVNDVVCKDIKRLFGRHCGNKCHVVENGINTNLFYPDRLQGEKIRERLNIPSGAFVVLSVGRLSHGKGHEVAIDSIRFINRNNKKAYLVLVGDGPFRRQLEKRARGDDYIIFTGAIENESIPAYYNACDLFMMPTMTREGLPLVLIEAMACGKPVIATPCGGNINVILPGITGEFVPPGDHIALAEKIYWFMRNTQKLKDYGKNAREVAIKRYSLERMIDRYEEHMLKTVSEYKNSFKT